MCNPIVRQRLRNAKKKTARNGRRLDNFILGGYTEYRKGAAGRRLALYSLITCKEVTATVGAWGGYFFLLTAMKRPIMPMMTSVY